MQHTTSCKMSMQLQTYFSLVINFKQGFNSDKNALTYYTPIESYVIPSQFFRNLFLTALEICLLSVVILKAISTKNMMSIKNKIKTISEGKGEQFPWDQITKIQLFEFTLFKKQGQCSLLE